MKINIERIKWLVIGLLAFALLLSANTCNQKKKQITQLELDKQQTDSIKNKLNQTIYTQEVLAVNDKQTIKDLTDSLFNLTKAQDKRVKDVIAYYKGITKTEIKDVKIPYIDTPALKKWEDSVMERCSKVIEYYDANTISVPRTAKDSTKDYKIDLTIRQDSLVVDSIIIVDSQYIRFATIKGGFLKKDTYGKRHLFLKKKIEVQVLHTNKFIKVTGQNSAIYIPPKKARWLEKALLIGAGIFLGTKL